MSYHDHEAPNVVPSTKEIPRGEPARTLPHWLPDHFGLSYLNSGHHA
jgi:hypothetical protein